MKGHVILFRDKGLRGPHKHVFGVKIDETIRLDDFNDEVSSFVVLEGYCQFAQDINFDGPYDPIFGPGVYKWVKRYKIPNDQISAVKFVPKPTCK